MGFILGVQELKTGLIVCSSVLPWWDCQEWGSPLDSAVFRFLLGRVLTDEELVWINPISAKTIKFHIFLLSPVPFSFPFTSILRYGTCEVRNVTWARGTQAAGVRQSCYCEQGEWKVWLLTISQSFLACHFLSPVYSICRLCECNLVLIKKWVGAISSFHLEPGNGLLGAQRGNCLLSRHKSFSTSLQLF